jgi:hypothetical protein
MNPATCNPPASAGGSRRRTREVALLKGASGSCRRGLHCQCSCRTYLKFESHNKKPPQAMLP